MKKNIISAWEKVEIARNPKRKTALEYIENIFDDFTRNFEYCFDRKYPAAVR